MEKETFLDHFGAFADFAGGVDALRSLIVFSMIQGKLVSHRDDDEPASVLLENIRKEKQEKVSKKEIPASEPVPEFTPGDAPFELPANWAWSRWGDVILSIEAGSKGAARAKPGDFLVAKKGSGEVIGKSSIVKGNPHAPALGEEVMRLEMSDKIDPRFFDLTNNSPAGRAYYAANAVDDGPMKAIESTAITHMPFPIPPRAEQERLVEKAERLLGLCDELEERLKKRDEMRRTVLEQAVGQLLLES